MNNTAEILALAETVVKAWDWNTETTRPEPDRLDAYVSSLDNLVPIVVALRVKRLGHLSAITGLDPGPDEPELEILYHFTRAAAVITLRVRTARHSAHVPTLTEIIPGAEAFERELQEMFGIRVIGLRNPARLYLPDDWPDERYPLRKDDGQPTAESEQTA
ncbi:MAG: NADH-quinone oxidoreductase subunit C [Anaerolineales bacterium]|nr:NADH-quinone oxidoreductase subunit C [Anaerolineales bacterium]